MLLRRPRSPQAIFKLVNQKVNFKTVSRTLVEPKIETKLLTKLESMSDGNPSGFKLRYYQNDIIEKCIEHVTTDDLKKRIGISLATGGGKTVIFSELIRQLHQLHAQKKIVNGRKKYRTLVIVNRRRLVFQATEKIKLFNPDANIQVEMAKDHVVVEDSDIIIASIASLHLRLDKYKPDDIDLIIVDEAHHAISHSYMKVLKHFHADTPSTKTPVLGFSATMERADKHSLAPVIDDIIYHKDALEMIKEKWLCDVKFTRVKISAKLDEVKKREGDFIQGSLSSAVNTPETTNIVMATYARMKKKHSFKSTLVFAVDIEHVRSLNEAFLKRGIKSAYVISGCDSQENERIIQSFKDGEYEVLVNCNMLTEGADIPNIDCILLCRPTMSRPLVVQMIGRGLRSHEDKKYCSIVDFVDASAVGVVSTPTLFGVADLNVLINDMTLKELEAMKEAQEKKREAEEKKRQEELERQKSQSEWEKAEEERKRNEAKMAVLTMQKLENQKKQETLREAYKRYIKNATITLLSYDTFRDFYLGSHGNMFGKLTKKTLKSGFDLKEEAELFQKTKYQWTQISRETWILPLRERYAKIERTISPEKYVLKLYTHVHFDKQEGGRWISTGHPMVNNLPGLLKEVDELVSKIQAKNSRTDRKTGRRVSLFDFSKYAKWRKRPATKDQESHLITKTTTVYVNHKDEFPHVDLPTVHNLVKKMSRGSASDLIFVSSIAPVYPIKSLLKLLNFGASITNTPPAL